MFWDWIGLDWIGFGLDWFWFWIGLVWVGRTKWVDMG